MVAARPWLVCVSLAGWQMAMHCVGVFVAGPCFHYLKE
ncbi:putative membrane protein [Chlamydia psittaci 10_743_SC13]|nr:putative membrane protein [Chlamydia psittaci 10_743_SC13]